MDARLFTPDYKPTPYWWEQAPLDASNNPELPAEADVLIIGAGYTGLHAALQTARAGLSTVVVDKDAAGHGCSSRNGGQISTSIKYNYRQLCDRYGEALARDILTMGKASLDYVGDFVRQENIDCDFDVSGRFNGAHNRRAYQRMSAELSEPNPVYNSGAFIVPPENTHSELGTDRYHGGLVQPHFASLHPAKYHAGSLQRVKEAGATLVSHCAVNAIDKVTPGDKFNVSTDAGVVTARKVIVATNGYTGSLTPWQQRRVIPIGSYIIATEEVDEALMQKLFPTKRMIVDSRKLVYYYRASPDHRRVLFGGRVSLTETDPSKSGPKLHRDMVELFPELAHTKISHSWAGTVAYTFDTLMHCGEQNGLHYAMGYCGSGVGMASYLGKCIGQQVADTGSDDIALSKIPFPTRPLYNGTPWFLAPTVWLYRMRDRTPL
jgi:glycine/D-amino acid oxidase-like deaminating enzyme